MILERDVVVVSGPDTFSFLQSLVSQDVEGLADGAVVPSLLLTPKGKIDSFFRLVRIGDDAWLDVEAGFGDALRAALERFKLRVKVEITVPDGPWGMLALRGHTAVHAVPAPPESGAVLPVAWPAAAGIDVIGPHAALGDLPAAADGLDADAYERMRIEAGVPRLGRDLDDRVIPQEAGLERDAVSFTKGCYLGQELVARIDSRGHVNRQLRLLRAGDGAAALAPGGEIIVDSAAVGTVTSAVAGLALGYVRREVDPPAAATVAGIPVTIDPLPSA